MSNFSQLEVGEDFRISFGLNIAGTSTQPSEVRITVGDQRLKVSALATINQVGEYEALIPLVPELFNGKDDVEVAIEVIIAGKRLVPYRERVSLNSPSVNVTNIEIPNEIPAIQTEPVPDMATTAINPISIADLQAASERFVEEVKPVKQQIQFTKEKKSVIIKPKVSTVIDFSTMIEEIEKKAGVKTVAEISKPKIVKEHKQNLFKITKTKIIEK